jgi:hypothetical protein
VTDSRETYKILDLALRVGEILLSSGAGAADVTATMLGITHHLGLRNADIDYDDLTRTHAGPRMVGVMHGHLGRRGRSATG